MKERKWITLLGILLICAMIFGCMMTAYANAMAVNINGMKNERIPISVVFVLYQKI